MMNRAARTRAPLGSRQVNVENGSSNNNNGNGKSTVLPSKKDSRSNSLQRQGSSNAGSLTSEVSSAGGEGNKAFTSLSSETLRRAISSASVASSSSSGAAAVVGASNNDSTTAETGAKKRQPLGMSKQQSQAPNIVRTTALPGATSKAEKLSSAEPITIVEHRKRPCGDGYTVHKYLRGKLLGKGGFAKVYKVTSLDTNKEYAAKIVPKANLVKSRARQKLQTEIKIHRAMKHANICEYKHFFEDKVNCYILLEICHNHSMNEMIKRRKSLTEEETRLLMMQMVDAVRFMHDSNVIHRDLKLGNLFLSKTMNIKVGDFGLACRVDSTDEKRKTICGTPNYIAPEVIEGNKEKRGHSFEVDIWSMGVICFTMLVGKPPYESRDVKSTYRRILANEYSFPQGKVSDDARLLISSMLQTDPKMRPSLDEVRQHPFFTQHQIPGSLPSTCTVSAPIWSTDEFGELNAIKPKSALDIHGSKSSKSGVGNNNDKMGLKRLDGAATSLKGVSNNKVSTKKAASSKVATAGGGAFNIYDDVNDQVECKLDSQSNALASDVGPKPVNKLMEQMAACGFDDEARELPPASSPPSMSEPVAPSEMKQITPSRQETAGSSKTPSSQSSSTSNSNDDLHELVMMHSRLEECLVNYERIQNGGAKVECPLKGGEVWGAKKWVSRYVDYTSKYGLGFLLNDGSSGVYFNDSTKAVHSATGDSFVYVERRKAGSAGSGVKEPVSTYTLTNFPEDTLKKKVTLLKHFRSYLLDQQKRAEETGEAGPLSSNFEERQDSDSGGNEGDETTVFMKKWIKTKHAMLFRLSNGTVQVLFYDLTEVLISSEGNLITFVDKEKNRFVHSIAEIANKQHGDVSRRLKYAKEILSQLISASKR
mmetsp:Transcript_9347/g.21078  ORF Transcript_9347/g.21078 Transcript_9347/m.21078 type:complete len:877 (+) Transcript_9347:289-2919(+)